MSEVRSNAKLAPSTTPSADPETKELVVHLLHPNVTREDVINATGWEIRFADELGTTPAPTAEELEILRSLKARTDAHHAGQQ